MERASCYLKAWLRPDFTWLCNINDESGIKPDKITAKLICERARLGCKESEKVIKITGERLGQTVAILIDLFNPEKIVIGGIYPRAKDLLEGYALKVAKKEALTSSLDICQILPASLGESIDEYASLCSAIVG